MEYKKTVKKFVAGSDKLFDIFECTVNEVEEIIDSNGRKAIRILIGDQEIRGMHNKKVYEHLIENEGEPSFVVLWKTPKGNYLISYAWELWQEYLDGDTARDVDITVATEEEENHEAFVYMWINRETDMKYIGMHKGTPDDGYICSNDRLNEEYAADPLKFQRTILAYGSKEAMHELETLLLIQLGAAKGGMWYNLSNNLRK